MGLEITLSTSQTQAASDIERLFEQPVTGEFPLVAILGLSGVGKDTLWAAIRNRFPKSTFVDYHSIGGSKKDRLRKRHFVTTVIPAETSRLEWPGDIHFVVVKGMTKEETRNYVRQRVPANTNIERIVKHSLGIPYSQRGFYQEICLMRKVHYLQAPI